MRSCSDSISGAAIAANSEFSFCNSSHLGYLWSLGPSAIGRRGDVVFSPKVEADELTRWQEYAIAFQVVAPQPEFDREDLMRVFASSQRQESALLPWIFKTDA
jgi:hypothetical protein